MQRFHVVFFYRMHSRHSAHISTFEWHFPIKPECVRLLAPPLFSHSPLSSSSLLFASGISVWVCLLNAAVAGGYQGWIPTLPASQYRDKAMLWQRRPLSRSRKEGAQGLHKRGQWHTHTHTYTEPLTNAYAHTRFTSEESFQCSSRAFIMQIQSCI